MSPGLRRAKPSAALLVALGLVAALLALPAPRAVAQVDINPLKIVLLGDSYAAGNGARDAEGNRNYGGPAGCYRSPTAWAAQYVDWLRSEGHEVTFVNRACSGGVIGHFTQRRSMGQRTVIITASEATAPAQVEAMALAGPCRTPYPGDEVYTAEYQFYAPAAGGHLVLCRRFMEPQINAIGEDTDLVLLTGGGNDVNFDEIVLQCFALGLRDPGDCRHHVENAFNLLPAVEDRLLEALLAIRSRARPDTKVAVVGYPFLANNDDFELVYRRFGIWESDRYAAAARVRELGRRGDDAQQSSVDRANAQAGEPFAVLVDEVKSHFVGHEPKPELGSGNPARWMNEFEQLVVVENYHYNDEGHRQIGLLLRQFGTFGAIGLGTDTTTSLDLVLVVDTTGSMFNDIAAVQESANAVIDRLALGTQSYRVALIDYRDFPERTEAPEDYPSRLALDFTTEPDEIRSAVDALTLGDGGDFRETVWSALTRAFSLDWRPGVKKVALQFGDAPALDPEPVTGLTLADVVAASFAVDPVAVYAVDTGFDSEMGPITEATGGFVLRAPSPEDVADALQEVLDSAFAAPYAWIGTGYTGRIGEPVVFDGSGSYDQDGDITTWEWDVDGDGVYETSTAGPGLEHTYAGEYTGLVALRVTDNDGLVGLATAPVDISADGDGLAADLDNCPDVHNPGQEDDDGDGVGDLCDPDWELAEEDAEGVDMAIGPPPSAGVVGGPYSGAAGRPIAIAGTVSDPEGDPVTPTWYPSAGCAVEAPGELNTTITCDAAGVHSLFLAADDGNGGVVAAETSVIVTMNGALSDGVGLVDPATGIWHLRDGAGAETDFYYGNPGDYPFLGDWDCDGDETPGLYRQSDGFVYLRNSNTQGVAEVTFFFGDPGDVPVVGDFDNDGCDTVSIYRPSEARFYIINELGDDGGGLGAADFSFLFGDAGDKPVVGDWDDDGVDEIGLHRESTGFFYFRSTLDTGIASDQFFFGNPGDRFIAGDWGIVDGVETPAVFRPGNSTFYFRHTNTQGNADSQFVWGESRFLPVAGDFVL